MVQKGLVQAEYFSLKSGYNWPLYVLVHNKAQQQSKQEIQ